MHTAHAQVNLKVRSIIIQKFLIFLEQEEKEEEEVEEHDFFYI